MALVAIQEESIGYGGVAVLRDVALTVRPGERIALLGRSGAGKSTLIGLLYARLAALREEVVLVPQEHALVPPLTVFHNVYMGQLDRHGSLYNLVNLVRPWPAELTAVAEAAAPLGLGGLLRRPVATLSGGQKQRTAVARALFRGGRVLVADEPVSAVDEVQGRDILETAARHFETIIVALHDVELALSVATRVVGLKQGRIALDAAVSALSRERVGDLYRL